MSRYIDADELKSRMLNYYDCVSESTDKSNYRGETLMNYEVADMIEDCIDNAPTADVAPRAEWISVEERLPESNDRCIVWSFDYIWRIRFASYNNGTKRWYVVCGGEIKDTQRDGVKVTHWLPIPEPPKGDHHE